MCDVLVALAEATSGDGTLFAKNSDRPPSERQLIEWSPARLDSARLRATHIEVPSHPAATQACVLSRPAWCWGAEHGVNETGVAIGNATVYTTLDPRGTPDGLTGMDLVRLGLERAATATHAVEVLTDLIAAHGQGGSGYDPALVPERRPYWNAFLVADPSTAYVIDTSGREWQVDEVIDVRAISNRTSIPGFDAAHRHPRQPVGRLVDPRWQASKAVLARRPVTVASLQQHLRSHESCAEPGWSVCMHADGIQCTTASMVAELRVDGQHLIHALTGSPCAKEYTTFELAAAWRLDLAAL